MSDYLSLKLRVLGFVSIVAVVFWHGYMMPQPVEQYRFFYLFQNMATLALLRFSVPLFFAISGFLFFYKPFDYLERLKKRVRTLLVPYLLWSGAGVALVYGIQLVPALSSHMNLNWGTSTVEIIRHLTLEPIQYQFWFLRDLMVLAVLSPILYWLGKKLYLVMLPLFFLWWLWQGETSAYLRADSLFFFFMGAALALHHSNGLEQKFPKKMTTLMGVIWLVGSVYIGIVHTYPHQFHFFSALYQISLLSGVFFIWGLYDWVSNHAWSQRLQQSEVIHSGFFIFCFQEPVLTILEKVGMRWWGHHWIGMLLLFLILPTLVILFGSGSYLLFKRRIPYLFNILVGGR